jgi:hypothetical protein
MEVTADQPKESSDVECDQTREWKYHAIAHQSSLHIAFTVANRIPCDSLIIIGIIVYQATLSI